MIEQINTTFIFYGFFTSAGAGKAGLTVSFTAYKDKSSTPVVNAASATELAGGFYYYEYTGGTAEGFVVGKFVTADATVDQKEIPALMMIGKAGVENLDASVGSVEDKVDAIDLSNLDAAVSTRSSQEELDAIKGDDWSEATDSLRGIRASITNIPSQRNTQEI